MTLAASSARAWSPDDVASANSAIQAQAYCPAMSAPSW